MAGPARGGKPGGGSPGGPPVPPPERPPDPCSRVWRARPGGASGRVDPQWPRSSPAPCGPRPPRVSSRPPPRPTWIAARLPRVLTMRRLLPLVLIGCAFGCNRLGPAPAVAPPAPAPTEGSDSFPSKAEVLDYLDGKPMPLALAGPEAKAGNTVTLRRDQIDALQVDRGGSSVNGGPWLTSITFLANTPEGKYAVRAQVQHRRVEGKRAFFGGEV